MPCVRWSLLVLVCFVLSGIAWANADEDADDEKAEHDTARAVLAEAKIDIVKAIEIAQAKIAGAKPVYATSAKGSKSLRFDVFLWTGKSVTEVKVDAVSGAIKEVEENEDEEVEDLDDAKTVLAAAKITFAQAIATAKGEVAGGKAFAVEMELEDGRSIIEVELLAGDKVKSVEIDAVTGKVVEVEDEDD